MSSAHKINKIGYVFETMYKITEIRHLKILINSLEFLAHLIYQPKSLIQSCFVHHASLSCVDIGFGIGIDIGIICAHLPLGQG